MIRVQHVVRNGRQYAATPAVTIAATQRGRSRPRETTLISAGSLRWCQHYSKVDSKNWAYYTLHSRRLPSQCRLFWGLSYRKYSVSLKPNHSVTVEIKGSALELRLSNLRTIASIEGLERFLHNTDASLLLELRFWKVVFSYAWNKLGDQGVLNVFNTFMVLRSWPPSKLSLYDLSTVFHNLVAATLRHAQLQQSSSIVENHTSRQESSLIPLKQLCNYMNTEFTELGRMPPQQHRVYYRIMKYVVLARPSDVQEFHGILKLFPPSKKEIIALILHRSWTRASHEIFQPLLLGLPKYANLYEEIVVPMWRSGHYSIASSWHDTLLEGGYSPGEVDVLEPLVVDHGASDPPMPKARLDEMMRDIKFAQIKQARAEAERLFPQGQVRRTELRDENWARIIATKFLSINAAIRCLKLFNAPSIGPVSMRELLLRCIDGHGLDMDQLRSALKALDEAGIPADQSNFCRLVYKLLREEKRFILYDLATCDVHPEEFDNEIVQEALLSRYDRQRDARQIERTIAALLIDDAKNDAEAKHLNIVLRRAIAHENEAEVDTITQQMQMLNVAAERQSLQWMFNKLLPERRRGHLPASGQIKRLVRLWSSLMYYEASLPPMFWDDILRTLLIQGDLETHEDLIIKLVQWYSHHRADFKRNTEDVTHTLFRSQCLVEILMYSFHHSSIARQPLWETSHPPGVQDRAALLASHKAFRGLRLILRLQSEGIHIRISEVQAILRKRIWIMCTRQGLELASGIVVRRLPGTHERDYFRASEILIGARDRLRNSSDRRHRKARKRRYLEAAAGRKGAQGPQ